MSRTEYLTSLYGLEGRVAIVTGGTGVLGSAMALALAMAGARVGVLRRRRQRAGQLASEIQAQGGEAAAFTADVLDHDSLVAARDNLKQRWEKVHILVNAAGGNLPAATVADIASLFDLSLPAFQPVVDFIGEQNRSLLLEPDGSLTGRGRAIIAHTPAGGFGEAKEVCGALVWLCSPGANFVNGIVLPVDGGFSAFSGV